jgi:hypothetical protein
MGLDKISGLNRYFQKLDCRGAWMRPGNLAGII